MIIIIVLMLPAMLIVYPTTTLLHSHDLRAKYIILCVAKRI